MDRHAFMRACREGGPAIEQALRALDQSFFAVLYRDCVRTLRDRESARDLVQETFIRVWQRCASFHGDSELLPWIRAILRHIILDRLRQPEREVAMDPEGSADTEIERRIAELSSQTIPTPADAARRQQLMECFQRCWDSFGRAAPSHAMVMAWIVEDGLSNEEISELLGRSPGATREFISQCRKRARQHFAQWYELAFGVAET
ncbi:MAG TPA: RNA polymerase sigma factor [Steroidobacteraceae bacterium]|nr:RNA polymerase sigma factor [Steroidobacteraceae bacterium]